MELRDNGAGSGGVSTFGDRPQPRELDHRQLYNGAGEGLTRAFEIAIIPPGFGIAGYLLDRWLGIVPVLTIVLVIVAVVGVGARMWYSYDATMKAHDTGAPWGAR